MPYHEVHYVTNGGTSRYLYEISRTSMAFVENILDTDGDQDRFPQFDSATGTYPGVLLANIPEDGNIALISSGAPVSSGGGPWAVDATFTITVTYIAL
jgi:hypothetical protein